MNLILDIIFPKRCVSCKKFGHFFCIDCQSKLITPFDICPVCKLGSVYGKTHTKCKSIYSLDGFCVAFVYRDSLRKAIHKYKYKPYIEELTPIFTDLMVSKINKNFGFMSFIKSKPTVISIPLHWYKKHLRGFNQTELIAKYLAKLLNLPYMDILKRTKYTKPQSSLTKKERQENVENIFKIKTNFNVPKSVILFDDVWTTGSTLKNATKILKEQGAETIWALTLAR
ncbi:ComF family protein [Candidatus Gottesmanbacteria bacterium]|nr:ComF family protein [Candidatus Gottesmanbacteria bacterium]